MQLFRHLFYIGENVFQRVSCNELQHSGNNHQMVVEAAQTTQGSDQRDRSLTVLIPRAKYRPVSSQPSSTLLTMSTFEPEQKLLNYPAGGEGCRSPEKKVSTYFSSRYVIEYLVARERMASNKYLVAEMYELKLREKWCTSLSPSKFSLRCTVDVGRGSNFYFISNILCVLFAKKYSKSW